MRACTRMGCTDGPPTTLSTAQLPPTFMEAPTLVVLGIAFDFILSHGTKRDIMSLESLSKKLQQNLLIVKYQRQTIWIHYKLFI